MDIDSPDHFDIGYLLFNGDPHPFSNPDVIVVDLIRIGCIIGGVLLIGVASAEARYVSRNKNEPVNRLYALIALIMLGLSAILTEIGKLGDASTVRLLFNMAGVTFGTLYVRSLGYRFPGTRVKSDG